MKQWMLKHDEITNEGFSQVIVLCMQFLLVPPINKRHYLGCFG